MRRDSTLRRWLTATLALLVLAGALCWAPVGQAQTPGGSGTPTASAGTGDDGARGRERGPRATRTPARTRTPTPGPPTLTRSPTPAPTGTRAPTRTPVGANPSATPAPARPEIERLEGLGGGVLSGTVALQAVLRVPAGAGVERVELAGSAPCIPSNTERVAPYYLGGDSDGTPSGWDTSSCPDGSYELAVRAYDARGLADTAAFPFRIQNTTRPPAPAATPVTAVATASATPRATASATATAAAPARSGPTLVDSYSYLQSSEGAPGEPPDYDQTVYRPRQYAGGAYAGWDYLTLASTGINQVRTGDWFVVRLNRPARLAVLWRHGFDGSGRPAAVPGWLASWARGADSDGLPVFVKDVEAGEHTLGAVKDPGPQAPPLVTPYWLLLAEAGGVPPAPPVQAGSPAALPNQRCPAWVHDQYAVVVDGVRYATWHRQIDPVYWCSFGHEHGSDPALFGDGRYRPAFGRSAAATGIVENHEGFKLGVYRHAGYDWLLEMHFGTVNAQGAACNRFHEVGVAIADAASGTLLADVMVMADMGQSVENTTLIPLRPQTCPQANDGVTSGGARLIPVQNGSSPGNPTFYEPWRADFQQTIVGLQETFSLNTPDPIAICLDYACSQNVFSGAKGARRFYNVIGAFGVDASKIADLPPSGVFYTDGFAKRRVAGSGAGALRQYVRPGTNARNVYLGDNHTCVTAAGPATRDRFRARYQCVEGVPDPQQGNTVELEGSLRSPN